MFNLINKIVWVVSLALSFSVIGFLSFIFEVDSLISWFNNGFIEIVILILISLLAFAIKCIFFSKKYIEKVLHEFQKEKKNYSLVDSGKNVNQVATNNNAKDNEGVEDIFVYDRNQQKTKEENGVVEVREVTAKNDEVTISSEPIIEEEKSKILIFIHNFFAKNFLAKIGGILLFLGVLFLLKLAYTSLGPVSKLISGFIVGFVVYFVGVFVDKKKFVVESRVLLGTSLVINYLVILSGRYLLQDVFTNSSLLSDGVAMIFLILNTVFAIGTALYYRSNWLLYFAFTVAFINPFLIDTDSVKTPYLFVAYAGIVAIGSMLLAYINRENNEKNSGILLTITIIGANNLFFIAPFQGQAEWIFKLIISTIFSISIISLAYYIKEFSKIFFYFIVSYLSLFGMLALGVGTVKSELVSSLIYFGSILGFIVTSLIVVLKKTITSVFALLIIPLILLSFAGIIGFFGLDFSLLMVSFIIIFYGIIYGLVYKKVSIVAQYIVFIVLGIFAFLSNGIYILENRIFNNLDLSIIHFSMIAFSSLLFLVISYYFSYKEERLSFLYIVGTMGSIFTVLPILSITNKHSEWVQLSALVIIFIVFLNLLKVFFGKIQIVSSSIGLVIGSVFATIELYLYGDKYFPGISLGFAFVFLAIIYLVSAITLFIKNKTEIYEMKEENLIKTNQNTKDKINIIFTFFGIILSMFALAVAIIFSGNEGIIATIWFLEASVVFFIFNFIKNSKIFLAGSVVYIFGFFKLLIFYEALEKFQYSSFVLLSIIFLSSLLNLYFIKSKKDFSKWFYQIPYILVTLVIFKAFNSILLFDQYSIILLKDSILVLVMVLFYVYLLKVSKVLWYFLSLVLGYIVWNHIGLLSNFWLVKNDFFNNSIQILISGLIGVSLFLMTKSGFEKIKKIFAVVLPIFLFLISSEYVFYRIFDENIFAVTIYWGILSFVLIGYGIQKDFLKSRVIGLYILIVTIAKILLFDIWFAVDNLVTRIIALILVGSLTIAISIFYTKKCGDNWKEELDWKKIL